MTNLRNKICYDRWDTMADRVHSNVDNFLLLRISERMYTNITDLLEMNTINSLRNLIIEREQHETRI